MLFIDICEIKNEDLKKDLELYLTINQQLNEIINLVREFKKVIFSRKPKQLDKWLEKATNLNVPEINSFVNLIKSDIDAVKNSIKYPQYSNGVTEGFNNKTKVIKRQMYGRCSSKLLRLKILANQLN